MTKISRIPVNPKDFGLYVHNLWLAFSLLDTKEDVRLLFRDLFTHTEYKMFAKRLEIAKRLLAGQNYESIKNDLKVTSTTIATVSNILAEKGEGFRKVAGKLEDIENKRQKWKIEQRKNLENPFRRRFLKGK